MNNLTKEEKKRIKSTIKNFKYDIKRLDSLNKECCEYCRFDITLYPRKLTMQEQAKFEQLDKERLELLTHCRIMNDLLGQLNRLERDIIEYVFVKDYTIKKVSYETHYSERSICYILNKVYNVFKDYIIGGK